MSHIQRIDNGWRDPTGTGEKRSTLNKVCTATASPVLRRPSSPIPIAQADHAITALSTLRHFGLEGFARELLAADGVRGLGNLLSLEPNFHPEFDSLDLWL